MVNKSNYEWEKLAMNRPSFYKKISAHTEDKKIKHTALLARHGKKKTKADSAISILFTLKYTSSE